MLEDLFRFWACGGIQGILQQHEKADNMTEHLLGKAVDARGFKSCNAVLGLNERALSHHEP